MENTLENKSKFFALYWGLEFTGSDHYGEYMPSTWSEYPKYIDKQYLILKHLSSISDYDFKNIVDIKNQKSLIGSINRKKIQAEYFIQEQTDFLRSRGYALPWMGLSVEQLIKYGWIKLKK